MTIFDNIIKNEFYDFDLKNNFDVESVFSEATALGLEMYSAESPGFLETANFVKFISNIWKIMSVRTPYKGKFVTNCKSTVMRENIFSCLS